MKITILVPGKTREMYLQQGIGEYMKRIARYVRIELRELPEAGTRSTREENIREKEGAAMLRHIRAGDKVVLLDEKGKNLSSVQLAQWLEERMLEGAKNICFVIGGAYGLSPELDELSAMKLSLSKMTFSHQMARLIFLEQLYRAFTIIKGEPYHHA